MREFAVKTSMVSEIATFIFCYWGVLGGLFNFFKEDLSVNDKLGFFFLLFVLIIPVVIYGLYVYKKGIYSLLLVDDFILYEGEKVCLNKIKSIQMSYRSYGTDTYFGFSIFKKNGEEVFVNIEHLSVKESEIRKQLKMRYRELFLKEVSYPD